MTNKLIIANLFIKNNLGYTAHCLYVLIKKIVPFLKLIQNKMRIPKERQHRITAGCKTLIIAQALMCD